MLPSKVTVVQVAPRVEGLHLPTMPKAETALDRPEEPFWPILVRLPRSRRPSNSRTSSWLYTCYKQTNTHTDIYTFQFIHMQSYQIVHSTFQHKAGANRTSIICFSKEKLLVGE